MSSSSSAIGCIIFLDFFDGGSTGDPSGVVGVVGVEVIGTSGVSLCSLWSSWSSSDDKDGRTALGLATFFPFPRPPFPFEGIVEVATCSFYKSLKREANIINISLKISIVKTRNTDISSSISEMCSS